MDCNNAFNTLFMTTWIVFWLDYFECHSNFISTFLFDPGCYEVDFNSYQFLIILLPFI